MSLTEDEEMSLDDLIQGALAAPIEREARDAPEQDAAVVLKSIRQIIHAVDRRSKAVSRRMGLTVPQIVVLQAIRDLGEVTTNELSRAADLSAPTVVTILDKLEGRGLVERYRSKVDRRIVHSRLTDQGRSILSTAPTPLHEEFALGFSNLPPARRAEVRAAFETVAELLTNQPKS